MCEGKHDIALMKETLLKIFGPDHVAGQKEITRAGNFAMNEVNYLTYADRRE